MNRLLLCENSDPFTLTKMPQVCGHWHLKQLNDPLCAIGDPEDKLDHYMSLYGVKTKHTPTNDALKKRYPERYLTHIRLNCHSFSFF